jgi:hypothetical protein
MMTPRRLVGLFIAALVIIAVAFWVSSRGHRSDLAVAGQPVLDGLKASVNDVTELHISKGDGTRVTLKKLPDAWQVAEREYTADSGKVRKLLLDLAALQVVEEKTSDPASYERIGVEDVKGAKAAGTLIEVVRAIFRDEVFVCARELGAEELSRLAADFCGCESEAVAAAGCAGYSGGADQGSCADSCQRTHVHGFP